MKDEFLSQHVPATCWFNASNLEMMVRKFPTLYIKPDRGSQGHGIVRVRRISPAAFQISYRKTSQTFHGSPKSLYNEVKRRMLPRKTYIIQQGITLATYHNRPFDIRVVLQRPSRKWYLTWMSAKIASKPNSVVTNVAQGAVDKHIYPTLKGIDQARRINISKVMQQLETISYRIARKLGARYSFQILGLDMAIDRNGKIWFIEANTLPSFHGLRKIDPEQYKRYLKAKRLTEANNRRRRSKTR